MRALASTLTLFALATSTYAQSVPNGTITQGQVWTPSQWNSAWQSKVDTNAGQINNSIQSAQTSFKTYDGSIQFSIGLQIGAAEFWAAQGGKTGLGANFFATNGTLTGNVDGNFVAQNLGSLWFGNGSGWALQIADPGGVGTAYLTARAGTASANPTLGSTAKIQIDAAGSSDVVFSSGGIVAGKARVANGQAATGTNVALVGAASGSAPSIRCEGDTNTNCWIRPTGTGSVTFVNDQGTLASYSNSSAGTIVGFTSFRAGSSTTPALVQGNSNNIAIGGNGGGAGQLATNATLGFAGIPTMNGVPTGTPASNNTAYAYLVYNSASHTLNLYDNTAGAWYHLTLTAGAQ